MQSKFLESLYPKSGSNALLAEMPWVLLTDGW